MSGEYKQAKEAFVSDNPGESIWSIQVTSLTALSAYALYAVLSRRARSPILDYVVTVLPLLISVTSLSTHGYLLNALLVCAAWVIHYTRPSAATATKRRTDKPSQGKWLDESDSDEEPSQPVYASSTSVPLSRLSTSSTDRTSSRPISPIDPPSTGSTPDGLSPRAMLEKPELSKRNRRRHSPTPSTHTHMAIEILPTPETDTFAIVDNPAYPPHPRSRHAPSGGDQSGSKDKLPFLSVYRAHMMIMTIHCILAVDFPVFPRYQGKCEDFGTSLMDVGVGSFVFSLGLVTSRSIAHSLAKGNHLVAVFKALKKASPILLLGLVRVLMVKGSEYPEHVTEYGVHWNFFFTLGLLPVLGILFSPLSSVIGWTPFALLVGVVHHLSLSKLGLEAWILSPERIGLIGMNKEGLVSLPGYLAIYALGVGIGQHILRGPSKEDKHRRESRLNDAEHLRMKLDKRRTECALELFGYSVGWWILLIAFRLADQQVSRRMANFPYVLWTVAYNTTFLLGYLVIEILFFPSLSEANNAVPPLLDAINKNGLAVFLLANLATGLVNVSMETMYASDPMAMGVLVLYSGGISALAWQGRGSRLKI